MLDGVIGTVTPLLLHGSGNSVKGEDLRMDHWTGSRRRFLGLGAAGAAGVALGTTLRSTLGAPHALAASRRSVVATPQDYGWVANHGLDAAAYQAEFDRLTGQGFRLIKVSGYSVGGSARYASIWTQAPGPAWSAMHGVDGDTYQAQFDSLASQGYRPVDISGYEDGGGARYAAIFEQSDAGGWAANHGIPGGDYQGVFDTNAGNGLRPLRVSGYTVGGATYFACIWVGNDGRGWIARHGVDFDGFQATFDDATNNQGMRLVDVSGWEEGGTARYTATYDTSPKAYWISHTDLTDDSYQRAFDENGAAGYVLANVAGYGVAGQAHYAAIWTSDRTPTGGTVSRSDIDKLATDALAAANVPGVSVAIAKDGQLVYAKAYGVADRSTGEALTINHRLRIASVSKPFTATVIMQLAEAGQLTTDDFVFGDSGWLRNDYGTLPYNQNMYDIQIHHLLTHTSGGWGGSGTDPMFQHTEMDHDQLITWALDNLPPANTPGTVYDYANFGYCLLGRIIERATGQSYEQYVRSTLLPQCGITSMQIAGDQLADRASNEVVYDGTNSTIGDPYGIPVHRMDSHGGWIATPTDLLRFLARVDQLGTPGDVVGSGTLSTMLTGSAANANYGFGFAVNGNGWGHDGRLGGTESIIWRHTDGLSWAVIANGNGIDTDGLGRNMAHAVAWDTGTAL